MKDFEIIGWPDVQDYMGFEDFYENAALIESNPSIGIDSSTYLVSKKWLERIESHD